MTLAWMLDGVIRQEDTPHWDFFVITPTLLRSIINLPVQFDMIKKH